MNQAHKKYELTTETKEYKNIHNVPEETILKMKQRWEILS